MIKGYSEPYRLDRNRNGGGVLIYIREDIPSKNLISHTLPSDIEGLFIELNLRNSKWLLFGTYHPPSQSDEYFFHQVKLGLDRYSKYYEKFILIGDFNAEESEPCLSQFLFEMNAKNIVKEPTCYKSLRNPSCIDLIITNCSSNFQNTKTISTGLSDFHKMVVTVLKNSFQRSSPKEIVYRDYKNFDRNVFRRELEKRLNAQINEYNHFEQIFLEVLNTHAPIKKKTLRANHVPYMTKTLRKAIMKRSELETKYVKSKTNENLKSYKKQRNFCTKLYKKERKIYYEKLDLNKVTDNKEFWKTIKPFLSEKVTTFPKISLIQNDDVISDELKVAKSFSSFFEDAVNSLGIKKDEQRNKNFGLSNPVEIAINNFEQHPSIKLIKENVSTTTTFSFMPTETDDIIKEISNLDNKKNGTFKNIPTRRLKDVSDICSPILASIWNEEILINKHFPTNLKLADVTPVFKKKDKNLVENYRPVSVLPTVSKIFERQMQKQINNYITNFLSPYLCGYRKGFSTQYALLTLLERWKICLDKKGFCGAVLMDLSKAFDTINHELLIAKLHAYGFSVESLEILLSYLQDRWLRVKINTTFSSWTQLIQGVPQGSVLGPILFNIYINDIFFALKEVDICNFADDTTPYVCDSNLKSVVKKLEHNSELAIAWFETSYMKLNTDKCHLLISGNKHEHIWAKLDQDIIWETNTVKLLGVTIDNNLKFDSHIANICSKANRKLSALTRVAKFLSFQKRRILFKAFIESQFKYCPLVWMFHGRQINNKINKLHERALRIVYNDSVTSFEDLLIKDNSFTIHHQNIQSLATEIYKALNDLPAGNLKEFFIRTSHNYNLRSGSDLTIPNINTVTKGKNSISYFGSVLWNSIPASIRNIEDFDVFEIEIKKWKPTNCPCQLCKDYVANLGYVNISNS